MPDPNSYETLNNPVLSNFAQNYVPSMYINRIILPPVIVGRTSGSYTVGRNGLMLYDTERAPRTQPKQVDHSFTTGTYSTREHSLDHPLDMVEVREAEETGVANLMQLKKNSVSLVMNLLELRREYEAMSYVFGAANYDSNNKLDLSSSNEWDDYTSGDPIGDINNAIEVVKAAGARPNCLAMDSATWHVLRNHPDLIGYFKNQMGVLTAEQVKSLFDPITMIVITDAVYNSGTEASETLTPLVEHKCAVLPVPSMEEMLAGARVHSALFDKRNAYKTLEWEQGPLLHLQQFVQYGVELVNNKAGFLFSTTITA